MTTIEKKIEIPENHRLVLDLTLPADMPTGEADICVTITPKVKTSSEKKAFAGLAGLLKNSKTFSKDALEMRDEW